VGARAESAYERCAPERAVLPLNSTVGWQFNVSHDSPKPSPEVVMKRNLHGPTNLAVVFALCIAGTPSLAQSTDPQNVIAQRITAPKASPKIATVLWTRRPDHYTLQVVFPRSTAVQLPVSTVVTLWLLAADGTSIPTSRDPPPKINVSEISYSVPLSSGQSAVAVALKIDDDYFIEKLNSLD
jgi:hypothetical protein